MKTLVMAMTLLVSLNSFAAPFSKAACYAKAKSATEKFVEPNLYDTDGIDAVDCETTKNKNLVNCVVAATKGGGDAVDSYQVTLTSDCKKVYAVELMTEE